MSLSSILFLFLTHLGVGIALMVLLISRVAGVKVFRFNAGLAVMLLVIALALALTAGAASQLSKMRIDTSFEGVFDEEDPARVTYDRFREQFGRDTMILVAIQPPAVFDLDFLEKLRAFQEDVEENVPRLVEVTSLINVRATRGVGDELIVGDFLEDWPETPEELAEVKRRALSNPVYVNNIVSKGGDFTALVIETEVYGGDAESDEFAGFDADDGEFTPGEEPAFLTGTENAELVVALYEVMARHESEDFPMWAGGNPVQTLSLIHI